MISDITLGQFFPGYSVIHKLDPRTKIIISVLFIITVFLANNPLTLLFLAILTFSMILLSRISTLAISFLPTRSCRSLTRRSYGKTTADI